MYVVLAQTTHGSPWIADQTIYTHADDARASAAELRALKPVHRRESYYVHEINDDDIDA